MTDYCPTCASSILPGARFCSTCGTAIAPKPAGLQPTEQDEGYARFYADEAAAPRSAQPQSPVPPEMPAAPVPPAATGAGLAYGEANYREASTDTIDQQDFHEEPRSRSFWPWVAGIAFLIAGSIAVYGFMQDGRDLTPISDEALSGEVAATPAEQTIIDPRVTLYAAADANVRDKPTTAGTKIVSKITRGSAVQGDIIAGAKGDQWLKLEGQEAYISLVNLVKEAPPRLVSTDAADAVIKTRCSVLERPVDGSAVKVTLNPGAKVRITGLTDTGYVEMGLPRGGSGYAADNGAVCFQAPAPEEAPEADIPVEGEQSVNEPVADPDQPVIQPE